jgi:hypothetical protein
MENDTTNPFLIRMNGATRADRLTCTAKIREIIVEECHGWIGDFYQYSNTSLCLHFEIPAASLPALRKALSEAGVGFGPEADRPVQRQSDGEGNSAVCACTLQITFVHDEPDLRREIPAVPG